MTQGNGSEANPSRAPAELANGRGAALWAIWWPVLRTMLSLLRRHGLRILLFAFVIIHSAAVTVILWGPVVYCFGFAGISPAEVMEFVYLAVLPLVAAVAGPLESGYQLSVYRLLVGEKAGILTLVAGYRRIRLFLRLAVVSAALAACDRILDILWSRLPWDFCWDYFFNIVTPGSPLDQLLGSIPALGWFIGEFHFAAKALILLPIQWALLEVIVGGKSWPKALAGSARLAWRHKHLAMLLLGVVLVLSLDTWLRALLPHRQDYVVGYSHIVYWLVDWGGLAGHAAITCAVTAVKAAALVVIYHAMRKDDEAPVPAESA